jgi:hypothetical protein
MQRKNVIAAIAAVVVVAAGFVVADMGQASSCDGKTSSIETAQASSCSKTRTAQASSCTKTSKASAAKMSSEKTSCSAHASASCCAAGASASHARSGKASCCAASARQAHYAEVKEIADPISYRENSRVVVAGAFECGSCDIHKTSSCQAFIKTDDGKMIPLVLDRKVKGMHMSKSREFEVTGRIKTEGGIKFLEVTSYKAM